MVVLWFVASFAIHAVIKITREIVLIFDNKNSFYYSRSSSNQQSFMFSTSCDVARRLVICEKIIKSVQGFRDQ